MRTTSHAALHASEVSIKPLDGDAPTKNAAIDRAKEPACHGQNTRAASVGGLIPRPRSRVSASRRGLDHLSASHPPITATHNMPTVRARRRLPPHSPTRSVGAVLTPCAWDTLFPHFGHSSVPFENPVTVINHSAPAGASFRPFRRPDSEKIRAQNPGFRPIELGIEGLKFMRRRLATFLRNESGATAIEYGLIAAAIAVAIIAVVQGVGSNLKKTFGSVSSALK
jgi:pilus assembly protein Flp/PilA